MKDEKSSSSCLVEPNKTSLEEREEERFKRGEEGREFCIQSHFPIRELKPLELWCPANLICKVASQISVFSRSVSLYLSPPVPHCPSSAVCPSCYASFSPTSPCTCTIQPKISQQCTILLSQHIYDLRPLQRCFELCGASVT